MQILIKDPADRKFISEKIPRLIKYWKDTEKYWEEYQEEFHDEESPKYKQSAIDKAEKLYLMKYFMDGYFEDDLLLSLEDLELLEEEIPGN